MDVYLVRHAIAHDRDPEQFPDDSVRPLTEEGVEKFRSAARGLGRLVPTVDVVLASPHTRAWDTAVLLNEEVGWPEPEPCQVIEAEREAFEALTVLDEHDHRESVALVGHEPYLSRLASLLITGDGDTLKMDLKKGGVIALEVEKGACLLRWSVTPKMLRALD